MSPRLLVVGTLLVASTAWACIDPPDPRFDWSRVPAVSGDFDHDGTVDAATLGIAADSVALQLTVDGKMQPLIELPRDGSKQFAICRGPGPTLTIQPRSGAPREALGEAPAGYEACAECVEIVVADGECDPVHFYWNTEADALDWWRE
jgi:hypothetical protein